MENNFSVKGKSKLHMNRNIFVVGLDTNSTSNLPDILQPRAGNKKSRTPDRDKQAKFESSLENSFHNDKQKNMGPFKNIVFESSDEEHQKMKIAALELA